MGICHNNIRKNRIKANKNEERNNLQEKVNNKNKENKEKKHINTDNYECHNSNHPTGVSDESPSSKIFPKTPSNISTNSTRSHMITPRNSSPPNFIIEATIGEKEIPIYLEKGQNFSIVIEPINNNNISHSKWSFLPNENPVDFKGYSNYQYNNINVGAILLRIKGSQKINLLNKSNNTFIADSSGNILISANLDPNDYSIYEPKGFLSLKIIGGNYSEEKDLNSSFEINLVNYNFQMKEIKISEYINEARCNMLKFIEDYFMPEEINNDLKDFIEANNSKRNELKICEELNIMAREHCEDLCHNNTCGKIGTDGSSFSDRIKKKFKKIYYFDESIIYEIDNPLLIVKRMIQDKYSKIKINRKNIFFIRYNKIGICLRKHLAYKFCCVIVFSE
jgi:hypothetical protein